MASGIIIDKDLVTSCVATSTGSAVTAVLGGPGPSGYNEGFPLIRNVLLICVCLGRVVHKAALDLVAPEEFRAALDQPDLVVDKDFKAALGRLDPKELRESKGSREV